MLRPVRGPLFVSLCALLATPPALADNYPERPIRLVVPFAPGGGTDINARIIAPLVSESLGQQVVVDNRPGAGSILGTEIVSNATPDGYTVLLGSSSLAVNAAVYRELPYNARKDFDAVTLLAEQPNIVVVHPSSPAKTLKEFTALVQGEPGKFSYGTPGIGTATHLGTLLLLQRIKADLVHIPYKGTGPALIALFSNEIAVYLSTFASALPHVKNARLRGLAVTSAKRSAAMPDLPTVQEAGVPGYEHATWYGIVAPKGTPKTAIAKLNKAIVGALTDPKVRAVYTSQGLTPHPMTPAQFAQHIDVQTKRWINVVASANIPRR